MGTNGASVLLSTDNPPLREVFAKFYSLRRAKISEMKDSGDAVDCVPKCPNRSYPATLRLNPPLLKQKMDGWLVLADIAVFRPIY